MSLDACRRSFVEADDIVTQTVSPWGCDHSCDCGCGSCALHRAATRCQVHCTSDNGPFHGLRMLPASALRSLLAAARLSNYPPALLCLFPAVSDKDACHRQRAMLPSLWATGTGEKRMTCIARWQTKCSASERAGEHEQEANLSTCLYQGFSRRGPPSATAAATTQLTASCVRRSDCFGAHSYLGCTAPRNAFTGFNAIPSAACPW